MNIENYTKQILKLGLLSFFVLVVFSPSYADSATHSGNVIEYIAGEDDDLLLACTMSCPSDIIINCGDSTHPSNTGTPTTSSDCGTPTYTDNSTGSCPEVITRTWTVTSGNAGGNTCTPVQLANWDMDNCASPYSDYSEFTANYPNIEECLSVSASNVYLNQGEHSCNLDYDGFSPGAAMCIAYPNQISSFSDNHPNAVRLDVTFNPDSGSTASFTGFNFREISSSIVNVLLGDFIVPSDVNYPRQYGIRISKNGQEIFQQTNIATSGTWSLEDFDFSNNPDFTVSTSTTFKIELLPYNFTTTGFLQNTWDVDQFEVYGCSMSCTPQVVTCTQTITVQETAPPLDCPCPSDITIACGDSTDPSNTGNFPTDCSGTYTDNSTGTCPEVITRTWTFEGDGVTNVSCTNEAIVQYTMDQCGDDNGNFLSMDEFVPNYPNNGNCSNISASVISNLSGSHSCVDGVFGQAFCVDSDDDCSWDDDLSGIDPDDDKLRFTVSVNASPTAPFELSGLSFYEKAPLTVEWLANNQGTGAPPNDYPQKYGLRILANGSEVFFQDEINTTRDWTLETFNFSNIIVTTNTTFTFELLGYCAADNNSLGTYGSQVWDIDDLNVFGGCCTATTGPGSVVTCNQTITINDTTSPVITNTPNDITVECDNIPGVANINISDNCSYTDTYNQTSTQTNNGTCSDYEYEITRTWTATDDCGNSAAHTQRITVKDTTNPNISTNAENLTLECDGSGNNTAVQNWINSNGGASANDNCSGNTITWENNFSALSNECGATGDATVTFTATDVCGNTSQTTATVIIQDTTPPDFDTEAQNQTVECDGQGNQAQYLDWLDRNGGALVSDACSNVTITKTPAGLSNDCGETGFETVTFTATDECGNTAQSTATFTIEDTTPPLPVCQDITVQLDGNCMVSITPEDIDNGSSDVCGSVANISLNQTNFNCTDNEGNNTVILTVTDDCGNTANCSANVKVERFDLALRTILASDEDERVYPGEDVTFKIEVHNQGSLTASNIQIVDYIPTGLTLNDPAWTQSGNQANITLPGSLAPGQMTMVEITFTVTQNVEGTIVNRAEINSADAPNGFTSVDVDSNPDNTQGNDSGGEVNTANDDEINEGCCSVDGDDEDDEDPEDIKVEIFDLALAKKLAAGEDELVYPGQDVTFTIEVTNQGTVSAQNIEIIDYIPSGLTINDSDWSDNGNTASITLPGTLAAGASTTVDITFTVNPASNADAGQIINVAEISGAQDEFGDAPQDIDSTPDTDAGNDAGGVVNGSTDDTINNENGDEDDSDPEDLNLQIFDLALAKKLAAGEDDRVYPTENITFSIEISNQGTVSAQNIEITDYIPAGLALNDNAWTQNGNTATILVQGPLAPGQTTSVDITFTVTQLTQGQIINEAEISDAQDGEGDSVGDGTIPDNDSTPDSDQNNDNGGQVNGSTDDTINNENGDEDDADPEDITVEIFDVALNITLAADEDERVYPGEDVDFKVKVLNQGTVDATDLTVTVAIPTGLTLNDADWTDNGDGTASFTFPGTITAGTGMAMEEITFTVNPATTPDELIVNAEITEVSDDLGQQNPFDIDSTPDDNINTNDAGGQVDSGADDFVDGNGTGTPGDTNASTDEDDADPENVFLEIFDLALTKKLAAGEDELVYPGQDVTFTIEVTNQGTVSAQNIELTDYIPSGLTLNDTDWTLSGSNASITLPGTLAVGASTTVDITFTVNPASNADAGQIINVAEISDSQDEFGDNAPDNDSTPDTDAGNDAGGVVNGSTDDTINNENGDEDDSDPEDLNLQIFDLALNKVLATNEDATVYPGQDITFTINVFNQGTVAASNIELVDYIPSGLTLNDSDWTLSGGNAVITLPGTLAAGASTSVDITFTVDATDNATNLVNVSEIADATDELGDSVADGDIPDNDSTPDTNPNNDNGGEVNGNTDDTVDNENGDEDDADPEDINVQIFDLALRKTLADGEDVRVYPGQDITFTIEVFNQGTVAASNIEVTDYIPTGLTLNDGAWTGAGNTATITLPGTLAAGASTTVDITFTVDATTSDADVVNVAEISDALDENGDSVGDGTIPDNDSTPDSDPNNDTGGEVNGTTDDTINNENGDEDDSDPEDVEIRIFDLALDKKLAAGEDERVYPGQDITFTITVYNQGTVDAQNIEVTDYIPAGLTLNDVAWSGAGSTATITLPGTLAAGASTTVDITFTVDAAANAQAGQIVNRAEISGNEDDLGDATVPDNDSTADGDAGNDPGGVVNGNTDDTVDNENGDEDDSDPEDIDLQIFDLALNKVLAAGEDELVYPGQDITFTINVFNQGTVDAQNIQLVDYIPAGLTLNDAAWAQAGGNAVITLPGTLAAGASTSVDITFTVDATDTAGQIINRSEIQAASDDLGDNTVPDNDSTPDDTSGNDNGGDVNTGTDDEVNDDGTTDEDDEDPEDINVEIFDLALTKKLAAGEDVRVYPGQDITFTIEVFNQGTVAASNIEVTDYIPTGLTLNDGAWTGAGNTATITLPGTLAAGASTTVDITFTVDATTSDADVVNVAEITDALDENGDSVGDGTIPDNDSTPDSDPNNDTGGEVNGTTDDTINNENGDEDDSDPEDVEIRIFDLALDKKLAAGEDERVYPGQDITFTITVYNQGTVDAQNIEVTDYIPAGLTLNDGAWSGAGSTATITLPGTLAAGASTTVDITFTVDAAANAQAGQIVNRAEISGNEDDLGDATVPDNDSTADGDAGNDPGGVVNGNTDDTVDNENGDEDDSDPEDIDLQIFDLALNKVLAAGEDELVYPGQDITFTINVFNQGTVDAQNIQLVDYIPAGLTLNDAAWAQAGGNATITLPGTLAAGASTSVAITFTVDATDTAGQIINRSEIQAASDDLGDNTVPDNDSTPDDTSGNDNGGDVNTGTDDEVNDDGTTDEDDADPEDINVQIFDLALRKTLAAGEDVRVYPGQDITFTIEVFNQGTVAASNIEVTDYIPTGLTLNDGAWTGAGNTATITLPGTLAAGASTTVDITFTVDATTSDADVVNVAEITDALDENGDSVGDGTIPDNDSTPDSDPNNDTGGEVNGTTDDTINNENGDEDDSDPEDVEIRIFDLALDKKLAAGEDERVYPGQDITFTITVYNQGTVDAQNIEVTDYIPAGLTLNDVAWSGAGSTATITLPGTLAAGASTTVDITFTVDAAANAQAGQIVNRAEISGNEDDLGDATVPDNDSTADGDAGNDPGGVVNGNTDDTVDNENGDEDDSDPEDIDLQIFDLALNKVLAAGEDELVYPGQDITFTINVFNQGTVDAQNIQLVDYIPAGLTLNDAAWAQAGGNATITLPGTLAAGASTSVAITFTVDATDTAGQIINRSEIQAASDDLGDNTVPDNDSTPDDTSGNDNGGDVNTGTDDEVNDDGTTDEDDADPEDINVQIFDLALRKTLADGEDVRVYPGQDITFTIEVFNQGTVAASNIEVTDYIPTGLTLNDGAWTGAGNTATITLPGTLAAGASTTVDITFTVDATTSDADVVNVAEISDALDENGDSVGDGTIPDNDSTPDSDPNNDTGGEVNGTTDDTINNENGDEDDSDPEDVEIRIFDLALDKKLAAGEDERVYPGQDITFTITVYNQGTVDAQNIEVTDYIPAGLTLNDGAWSGAGSTATITLPGILAAGASTTVDITFTVDAAANAQAGQIVNRAEISGNEDDLGDATVPDNDSTADGDAGNDAGGVVNGNTDDTVDNENGDEDDSDPEDIDLQIFDLALNKVLAAGEDELVYPGQDITFTINVFNQGTVDAQNIQLVDYIPAGLTLNDAAWAQAGGNATITLPGTLAAGASTSVAITFTVDATDTAGQIINRSEIQAASDDLGDNTVPDNDSTPDDTSGNDNGGDVNTGTDDEVNDDGTTDEDDEDPEDINVEIFDLALRKTLAAGEDVRVYPGQDITFTIEVFNQGTIAASNIEVLDFIPSGLTLNDAAWTQAGANATRTIAGPVAPGASTTVDITFTVNADVTAGALENIAEIQTAEDPNGDPAPDNDSTPDSDPDNDPTVDNEIDNPNDEDDNDPEEIDVQVFDLALRKTLADGEDSRVYPGEDLTFTIEIFNQGTVAAQNVDITDYIPTGLTLNDPAWTAAGGNATRTIPGPIAPGASTTVNIIFTVDAADAAGTIINTAEITEAEDDLGDNTVPDTDSTPDSDSGNDPEVDNEIDNAGGDEDDADPEPIDLEIFDLAIRKTLADGQDKRVYPGENITFTIEVFNQGTVAASNIEVGDYIPSSLTLNDANWTNVGGLATTTIAGPIAPGASTTVDITFTVNATDNAGAGSKENLAEVQSAEDDNGDNAPDNDSNPDSDPNNDPEVNDEINDPNDEDDADPEEFDVQVFDLALRKTLGAGEDASVYPGQDITFTIEVFNQGTVAAQDVEITDYIPAGLTLNDGTWTAVGGNATTTIAGPIAPGASTTVDITFTVDASDSAGQIINTAEISEASDENGNNAPDNDSTPDTDSGNDPEVDNEIDNGGGDEDDADPEPIDVEIFDLALTKVLADGQAATVYPGQDITFTIEVTNQGTVAASNIEIADFIPAGLILNDANWSQAGNIATNTLVGPLAAGTSTTVNITFTVDAIANANAGTKTNVVEIQGAEDPNGDQAPDNDSTPDNDPDNDPTVDNATDDPNDEDDNDPEDFDIQVFDLALRKTLGAGEDATVYPGQDITFTIEVFNQGTVAATDIAITDYIPAGLTLNDGAWTEAGGNATTTIPGPIAAGASTTVDITFTVDAANAATAIINTAEISGAEDDNPNTPTPPDNDSTPDSDPTNDPEVNDEIDNGGGDEDDADPEELNLEIFDLALRKTLADGEDKRVYPGETITFTIEVFNQGTVAASNIVVEDFAPAGLTPTGSTTLTISGPIAPGASETVDVSFIVDADAAVGTTENIAEIQSAEDPNGDMPEDNDSTPDDDPINDPSIDNEINDDGDNDEDDNDLEEIDIQKFDLASNITLAPGEDDRVYPGETVSFKVTVFNQGTVTAENVEVTLMIPAELTSVAGIPNMGTITFPGPIPPGGMEMQIIDFVVDANATTAGELIIKEEISDYVDDLGGMPADVDSTPDADFTNDAGGVVDSNTDDTVDNENGDEDDADPENVFLEIFDLALTKTLADGEDKRVYPGEDITFTIEVYNQGSVPASNIEVLDFIPTGFTLNDPTWNQVGVNATTTIAGPIAPGASTSVDITLTVGTDATAGTSTNVAEVQSAEDDNGDTPEDTDSTPDNDPDNDPTVDNATDDPNDEDDNDPEDVEVEKFDLASNITLAPGEDDKVYPGETVSFKVTVFNQGTVTAENVEVTLMIPAGLTSVAGIPNMGTITFPGPITPGAMEMQIVEFIVDANATTAGELIIKEEISDYTDDLGDTPTDIDSTPDADFTNDAGGVVDGNTDDTVDNENGDEDDADPENVFLEIFDLALRKTLANGQSEVVYPFQDVTFTIEIFNQGSVAAANIEVLDFIPQGFELNDTDWTQVGANASTTIAGPIAAGASTTVDITLTVLPTATTGIVNNIAEIQSAEDEDGETPEDIDSDSDDDPTNDPTQDDEINDDGTNDEDDNDIEPIEVQTYDLALRKTLADGQGSTVYPGQDITFTIEVFNQSTVSAFNVQITDYIPAGLTLNDGNWTAGAAGAVTTIPGPIAAGTSTTVDITFTVDATDSPTTIVNTAEISDLQDENGNSVPDLDSTPDQDPNNDPEINDEIDDDGTNDEDDADLEEVNVEIFDLALRKVLADGEDKRVYPGDDVTFTIEVFNQGTVAASNIEVLDYIPAGLTLNDGAWTQVGSNASITIPGPLAPGANTSVDITFTVNADATAETVTNISEIQTAEDPDGNTPDDNDSDNDDDPNNDPTVDDEIDDPNDEDDSDPEDVDIEIFDLAVQLLLADGEDDTVYPGEDIDFKVKLFNQGTVDAQNVEVVVNIPSGLILNDSDWTDNGDGTATFIFTGIIPAGGGMIMEDITFTVDPNATSPDELIATTEIVSAEDDLGGNPTDIDSTPDSNPNNDAGGVVDGATDDEVDGDGAGAPGSDNPATDEDDADPENVFLQIFDLALTKTSSQTGVAKPGDDVTFTITVFNQGSVPAENIDVIDYLPSFGALSPNDNNGWIVDGSNVTNNIAGPLAPGASTTIDLVLVVVPDATSGSYENYAEITSADDQNGDQPDDIDSTPDTDSDNDAGGEIGSPADDFVDGDGTGTPGDGNAPTDEDDQDGAPFEVCDDKAPELVGVPEDLEIECSDVVPTPPVIDVEITAVDPSDDDYTITFEETSTQGEGDECSEYTYTITRVWTVTDECDNSSQATQVITVSDSTAPSIDTAAEDELVECGTGNADALAAWIANNGGAVANDNCSEVTWTNDAGDLSNECGETGTITVTFTATDECGNSDVTTATFTIEDTTPPAIDVEAESVEIECNENIDDALAAWLADNGGAEASDLCSGTNVIWTYTPDPAVLSDDCGQTGSIEVTFTATDDCGNTAQTIATFRVGDTTPPVIDVAAEDELVDCDGSGNALALENWLADNGGAEASDICGEVTWSYEPNPATLSDGCGQTGTVDVTFTATDDCGNTAQTTATFTIQDTEAPTINVSAQDETVECNDTNADAFAAWLADNGGAEASDICGEVTWSYEPNSAILSDDCGETGFAEVTFIATDDCGNTAQTTATYTVIDTTAPVAPAAPADLALECADEVPAGDDLTATDNCDDAITATPVDEVTAGDCPNSFVVVRTWTFTDACGNESSISQTITVEDTTAPEAPSAPADLALECADEVPAGDDLTATDNCDDAITATPVDEVTAGDCPNSFVVVRTWTFTDACGNESSISQTITVEDTTAPEAPAAPADLALECADEVPAGDDLTATDNCDDAITATPVDEVTAGDCPNSFVVVRTWTFTDACGNESSISQTITVEDTTAPEAPAAPADLALECADEVPAGDDLTATDNCDDAITATPVDEVTAGDCPNSFVVVRTWTFTDACGNESSISQTITVEDTTAPVAPAAPADLALECADEVPAGDDLTATDNCDDAITATPVDEVTAGDCPNSFVVVRTWTFTDACGNESSISQTITVEDTTAPEAPAAPADLALECADEVPAGDDLTATDNCDDAITATPVDEVTAGDCPNSFVVVRTWTFTDACGNESSISQTITVEDTTAPVAPAAPADLALECADEVPAGDDLTATDNCDDAITATPVDEVTAGDCPNSFVVVRTWTFTDVCGNESSISQTITVEDTTAPEAPAAPADLALECADEVPAGDDLTATDNCDDAITATPVDEVTAGDCPNSFVVVRTWTFTDACGNESSISQTITVEDTTAPEAPAAPADLALECADEVPAGDDLTATDNCDDAITATPVDEVTAGDCPNSFVVVRTWTFTDVCGNESSISQTITVEDTTAPEAPAAPADLVLECADEVPAGDDLTATDNCDDAITATPVDEVTAGDCPNSFVVVRTWTFTDVCGNESSISQKITVEDTTAPEAPAAPADLALECADEVPAGDDMTATDNCDDAITATPVDEVTAGDCPNSFVVVRTWTFTDACGNESSISQTITVEDTTAPEAPAAPADLALECADEVPAGDDLTATDNCDDAITATPVDEVTAGDCPNSFVVVRTWTFTDVCGNESSISQTITVEDTTAPEAPAAPADLALECADEVPAGDDLTATDNCDDAITATPVDEVTAGDCPNSFVVVRTWTFTDVCGNESSISQTITVEDTTAPVAPAAPADLALECADEVPAGGRYDGYR